MSSDESADPYKYVPPEIVVPVSWQVENEQFLETSRQLWGTEDYGVLAIAYARDEENYVGVSMWADERSILYPFPKPCKV